LQVDLGGLDHVPEEDQAEQDFSAVELVVLGQELDHKGLTQETELAVTPGGVLVLTIVEEVLEVIHVEEPVTEDLDKHTNPSLVHQPLRNRGVEMVYLLGKNSKLPNREILVVELVLPKGPVLAHRTVLEEQGLSPALLDQLLSALVQPELLLGLFEKVPDVDAHDLVDLDGLAEDMV